MPLTNKTGKRQFALTGLINQIEVWRRRICDRRHLARLDAHALKDMGLTCALAAREAQRPFWRAIRINRN